LALKIKINAKHCAIENRNKNQCQACARNKNQREACAIENKNQWQACATKHEMKTRQLVFRIPTRRFFLRKNDKKQTAAK
jgi:hypothetical protein